MNFPFNPSFKCTEKKNMEWYLKKCIHKHTHKFYWMQQQQQKKSFTIACMHAKHIQMCIMCINVYHLSTVGVSWKNWVRFFEMCWGWAKKFKNRREKNTQRVGENECGMRNRHECTFWNITGRWLTPCTTKQNRRKKKLFHLHAMYRGFKIVHTQKDLVTCRRVFRGAFLSDSSLSF